MKSLIATLIAIPTILNAQEVQREATATIPTLVENFAEVNVGYGKYGKYDGFNMGFEKKIGKLTLGINYQNTDHKEDILSNGDLNIHSIRDNREDFSFKSGYEVYGREVYKDMYLSLSPFVSLGVSKYDQYQYRGVRTMTCDQARSQSLPIPDNCKFDMTPDLATKKMMKVELGIKVELGMDKVSGEVIQKRDFNPYVEFKHQQYGNSSNFGATIGITAGF